MFNGLREDKKNVLIVTTKQELEAAVKRKEPYIEVQGELVKKLRWMHRLPSADRRHYLNAISSMNAFDSGSAVSASVLGGAAVAKVIGYILAGAISATLIIGILKGYDVEIEAGGLKAKITAKKSYEDSKRI